MGTTTKSEPTPKPKPEIKGKAKALSKPEVTSKLVAPIISEEKLIDHITFTNLKGNIIQLIYNPKHHLHKYRINNIDKVQDATIVLQNQKLQIQGISCGSWSGNRKTTFHEKDKIQILQYLHLSS